MNEAVRARAGGAAAAEPSPVNPFGAIERRMAWVVLALLSVMFLISMLWRPADESSFILCPFRRVTGLLCPGCGMTRAFCALGHGEPLRAVHFNALSPLLFLSLIVVWVGAAATVFNLHRLRAAVLRLRPNRTVSVMLFSLMLVWWVVRLAYGI